ncbi:MAG: peptidylprolyl isomerase [Ginsengibacter sp.]
MSIIQTIRDKGAAIVIGVIALSLIGFLLMDARSGASKGLFSGNTTTIGSVNGRAIDIDLFNTKVKEAEQQYPNTNAAISQQIRQSVWDQMVGERVVTDQFDKMGLVFTPKEMSATMFSDDAPQQLKQAFTDQQTGQYDVEKARQWWIQTKKSKNEEQRDAINSQVIEPMRLNSLYSKYTSMLSGSVYIPSWLESKEKEEDAFASISYVAIPYTDISDSLVKVSDDDVQSYLDKHKLKYKQEAGVRISYVAFSASPSSKDSLQAKEAVVDLKNNFLADTNAKAFVARNTSSINFFDGYSLKSKMQMRVKDSIISLNDGNIFGPYLDGSSYVIAKKVSTKILPDSIKCRHILLGTVDRQNQPLLPDSVAKKRADSIGTAIKGGADFDVLESKFSSDSAAHRDKGVMTFDLSTIQDKEKFDKDFADFLLNEMGETKKVIHTQFGWHYIEILEKKNPQPAYKIAYMAREIVPSDETVNAANAASTKISGMARDEKAFDQYISKNGIKKITVPNVIKENDFQVGALQDARPLIKWAFDAKEGEVSEPFSIGSDFVVAVVSKKVKEGLPDVKTGRTLVESFVRNEKKAIEIKNKLGIPASLEAAASVYKKQVLNTGADSTLAFNALIINGIGNEPKVAGAAFNKDFQTKPSPPIGGNTGVFVIKVNSINNKPGIPTKTNFTRVNEIVQGNPQQQKPGLLGASFNSLKKMADIKDKRSKFF